MLAIIDYGMGNTQSVYNAFQLLGENAQITSEKNLIRESKAIILPGVGAFSDGMKNLKDKGILDVLSEEVLDKKKPYLGICLGLEFLAKKSYEDGEHDGFGWINGNVEKISTGDNMLKVPHMGWNDTNIRTKDGILKDMENPIFYYLHSYYLRPEISDQKFVTSLCDYGETEISATIQKNNIFATQFHPEKSQSAGLKLLKNFIDIVKNNA